MTRQRQEIDPSDEFLPTLGAASPLEALGLESDHSAHTFLYLPDLTMETGWSTHRVPERVIDRSLPRRPIGFRHPERRPRHG